MKGDFSRNTFRPSKAYSRVLLQQGRVQLDADWNEQVSILLHQVRMLTLDCVGPYARPADPAVGGFVIGETTPKDSQNFAISFGRCYVNGLLVENPEPAEPAAVSYKSQPYWWFDPQTEALSATTPYFVYLDVWERFQTALEDPEIRESALGGPDTASRAQIVWQVKVVPVEQRQGLREDSKKTKADKAKSQRIAGGPFADWQAAFAQLPRRSRGALQAVVSDTDSSDEPCLLPATSKYRGENQLWRVEVHRGGAIGAQGVDRPTFKISSDNGSLVYPLAAPPVAGPGSEGLTSYGVELVSLGRDARTALAEGDWVELVDDQYALESADDDRAPDSLLQVVSINADELSVTLQGKRCQVAGRGGRGLYLRRWDQPSVLAGFLTDDDFAYGTFEIGPGEIKLDAGIRLTFLDTAAPNGVKQIYRRGDYWLIPGREASGDIEWPVDRAGEPKFQAPLGIAHHYAPLAVIAFDTSWTIESLLPLMPGEPLPAALEDLDEF